MSLQTRYTGEQLLQMQGDFELVKGELVEMVRPGPEHGYVRINVGFVLRGYVKANPVGMVVSESGFYLERDPDTVRGPDVAFYSRERFPDNRDKFFEHPPDLAVEIVSPNDTSAELEARVREFLAGGVGEVWVLYPRTRTVYRYRVGWTESLTVADTIRSVTALPGFECSVLELFE